MMTRTEGYYASAFRAKPYPYSPTLEFPMMTEEYYTRAFHAG